MSEIQTQLKNLSPEKLRLLARRLKKQPDVEMALPVLIPDPERRHEPFPLTDVQQSLFIGRRDIFELGNVSTHGYGDWPVDDLDLDRLNAALRRLIERHEMLRAVVLPDGSQQILREVPYYEVKVMDLRGRPPAEIAAALAATRTELSHQVLPSDRWPLFDIRVSHLEDRRGLLHVSFDTLIGDLWSFRLLTAELWRLYADPGVELEPIDLSYRDYVLALKTFESSDAYRRSEAYWHERLANLPPGPDLPVTRNLKALNQPQFRRRHSSLDPEHWRRLRGLATRRGLTPSGLLLTAYATILAMWSKTQQLTINITNLNRLPIHPHVRRVIGDFASLTLLSVDFTETGSFEERTQAVQRQLWENLEHGLVSAVRLMRELARLEQRAPTAMLPVVFTSLLVEEIHAEEATAQPWKASGDPADSVEAPGDSSNISQTPQVWLDHQVVERGGRLLFNWDAVEDLFPPGFLDDMFAAYCRLLERLADEATWAEPDQSWLLAGQAEERRGVNATDAPVPEGMLHDLFLAQARKHPDRVALLSRERTLSYGELDRLSASLARRLRREGAEPERLVAIVMEKGWEQAVAALAVLRSGAAYLPVDAAQPRDRWCHLLEHGEVRLVVTQPRLDRDFDWPPGITRLCVESAEPEDAEADPAPVDNPRHLAYVLYTSGTSGRPKGAMIEHRSAVNRIVDTVRRFGIGPEDRTFALTALHHDMSVFDLFGALAAGASVVFPEAAGIRDPGHWLEMIAAHRPTIWNSVPAFLEMLVELLESLPGEKPGLPLRLTFVGGDWIPLTLPERLRRLAPEVEFYSMGGPTETTLWDICHPVGAVDPEWRSIPYGRPMANTRYHVLNQGLMPRPTWVPGELCIAGTGLARGYWRDAERTAAAFVPHGERGERIYRSGDIGRYLPEGDLEILGREDFQVKIRGHRVELGEIEKTLERHPAVRTALVAATGEDRVHRRLVAYVVPEAAAKPEGPSTDEKAAARGIFDTGLEGIDFKLSEPGLRRDPGCAPLVRLPSPPLDEAVLRSFRNRVSRREFRPEVVSRTQLGRLLSALSSMRHPGSDPSRVAIALAVKAGRVDGVPAGLYRFHPRSQSLRPLALDLELDRGFHVAINRKAFDQSAFTLFLTAQPEGGEGVGDRDLALLEAGAMGQLLMESAPEAGLGLCPLGFMDFGRIASLLDVDATGLLHAFLAGPVESVDGVPLAAKGNPALQGEPLTLERLGDLLGGLRGLQAPAWPLPKYRFPSAGGLYPVQTYVCVRAGGFSDLGQGVYYYHPREHSLVPLALEAPDPGLFRGAGREAAFSLLLVGKLAAIQPKYGQLSRDFCLLEAGYMGQLLSATAGESGLGLSPAGDLDFSRVAARLALDGDHIPLHAWREGGVAVETGAGTYDLRLDVEIPAGAPRFVRDLEPAGAALDPEELKEALRTYVEAKLPYYMVPSLFMLLESLPLTANGKVDRKALPLPSPETRPGDVFEAPETPMQKLFCEIWRDLLGVDRIGIHDGFFSLGGDSVQAVQFLVRARQGGVDLTAREFFEHQTISILATVARSVGEAAAAEAPAGPAASAGAFSRADLTQEDLADLIDQFGEEDEELDVQV